MAVITGVKEERRLKNKETMAGTKKETEKKETGQECRIDTAAAELKKNMLNIFLHRKPTLALEVVLRRGCFIANDDYRHQKQFC